MEELESLETVFNKFALFGVRNTSAGEEVEIDATKVVKLAKDCGVLDKKLTRNQVDLTFHKVKQGSKRKLNFDEFVRCTELWARHKGISHSQLLKDIIAGDTGPHLSGTIPDAVAFHDDKSKFTGTHKNGGPESVAKGGVAGTDLSQLLDRGAADVRGVPIKSAKNFDVRAQESTVRRSSSSSIRLGKEEKLEEDLIQIEKKASKTSVNGGTNSASPTRDMQKQELEPVSELDQEYEWKVKVEGKDYMIHPDWEKRKNPKSLGAHDKYFFVNKVTNERCWSIPSVPITPPDN